MVYTRAHLEKQLIRRAGKWMTTAGLDGATMIGTNADLSDPIGTALWQAGFAVVDITAPVDGDVAALGADDFLKVVALAELRLLKNILGNYNKVNISLGPRSTSYDQMPARIAERIKALSAELSVLYGFGAQALSAGTLTLGIAESDDGDEFA